MKEGDNMFWVLAILGLVVGIFETQIDDAIIDRMYGVEDPLEDPEFDEWLLFEAGDDEY